MDIQNKKLILCDLDGTLIDTAHDIAYAMNLALQDMNLSQVTYAQIQNWIGKGTQQLCIDVLKHVASDINQEQELMTRYLAYYKQNVCQYSQLYKGVVEFLKTCDQQKHILACITNKPHHLATILLNHLNIEQYFKLILGGDSLQRRKPDPLPLHYAMQQFNIPAHQTLMIGDSQHDIQAAKAAGIDCIAVSYGYNHGKDIQNSQPTRVVANLNILLRN
ncbi:phosphoglycolate phosphatase [Acinetobacter sp. HY1485]|uniref:phosphoglycolate phosphatase n=1 Tax=Acinetobacter sp. HY1485 TaxID=2970918 RepID=UPI0022B9606B|nr:phosphoglycolate phosphatase [Acinetobacter sp. HY1485]